jgi:hypothetical protein
LDNNTHRTRATSGINNFSYPWCSLMCSRWLSSFTLHNR